MSVEFFKTLTYISIEILEVMKKFINVVALNHPLSEGEDGGEGKIRDKLIYSALHNCISHTLIIEINVL